MKAERILELKKKCTSHDSRLHPPPVPVDPFDLMELLAVFSDQSQAIREAEQSAREEEREAIAKFADENGDLTLEELVAAIRARNGT